MLLCYANDTWRRNFDLANIEIFHRILFFGTNPSAATCLLKIFYSSLQVQIYVGYFKNKSSPERWRWQKPQCKPKKEVGGQSLPAKLRSLPDFHHSRPTCPPDNIAVLSIILKVDDSPRGVLQGRLLVLGQTTPPVAQAPLNNGETTDS